MAGNECFGWFQGPFEWGPRALGNRSILVDSCKAEMKDIINTKIKFREPYRPFAPSVLAEYADVDGTVRPQLVYQEHSSRYWKLINRFREKTSIPMLLNTSFNLRGEPIVNTPENAINTFLKSEMDLLVLGNFVVYKT